MKISAKKKKAGFTLIELLVIVAIIGFLSSIILVALMSARTRAKTTKLTAAISSLRAGIIVCCATSTNTINTWNGTGIAPDLCSPTAVGAKYPSGTDMQATLAVYSVDAQCSATSPTLRITVTGHSNSACNTPNYTTVSPERVNFPSGCK